MAAGDQLDQVLANLSAEQAQQAQRRVPAPPSRFPPVTASGQGRAAPSAPPSAGGPSFIQRAANAALKGVDAYLPGVGTALGFLATNPKVATGVAAGVLRSPVTAAAGIGDFAGDVGGAISPKADFRNYEGHISQAGVSFRYSPQSAESLSGFSRRIDPLARVGNQTANEVSSNVASLAIGYGAGAKLAGLVGAAPKVEEIAQAFGNPLARTAITGAARLAGLSAVDAVVMDPETERFSNLLQNLGVHTQFTDWLAHKDDEGHFAGRFKNAVEGLGLGTAAEGVLQAGRYWHARLSGDHAAADAIQGQLAAQHDGQVPDYIVEPHPGEAPPKEPPGYVGGWENTPDGAVRPVYEEDPLKGADKETVAEGADDGLSQEGTGKAPAGSPGAGAVDEPSSGDATQSLPSDHQPEISSMPAMPGGSTGGPVRPMDPVAMARAMGDKEAEQAILSFRVKRTPNDPGTVVGPIDRAAIEGLSNDIRFWRSARASEGERAIDVTPGTDTAAAHGEFRLGNIGSQESVAPTLRALLDHIPELPRRTDLELMQDTLRAAKEIGTDPAALLESARLISGKLSDADTSMALIRTIWKQAEQQVDALPDTNWLQAPQADVEQAAQQIYNMLAISSHEQAAKAGLGRGLRVNQLPDADTYLNTVARADNGGPPLGDVAIGPLPRTRQEIADWFELWRSTKGDPELRNALLEGTLTRYIPAPGRYVRQAFANFFTASILSAPRTLLLNLIGPAAMSVIRNVERQSGAMVMAVNPFASASERQAARATARAVAPAYLQTLGDISDTMRWAWKAAERNKGFIGGGATIDGQAQFGPWNPELIEAARPDAGPIAQGAYSLGNAINMWPAAVQRINGGFDEFSKRLAYLGEVRVRALQEGIEQGVTGDDLRALVKNRLQSSTNEEGHALDDNSMWEAGRTTLTNPVGLEGGMLRKGGQFVNLIRKEVPETRYILPVFGVPVNTLGEALRRLPIAAMPGLNRVLFKRTADELAGTFGPIQQADAYGRMLSGAAFLTGGIMLNRMGILTGAGPQNPTDRKVWLLEHQPYSIRIGDEWVRYDRYDVLGSLLSIPATIVDATTNVREDQGYADMMLSGVGALAQWFKDRSALRGAAGLMALGDDPTANASTVASRTGGQILQGMFPNAIQSTVTQPLDPVQRMRRSWEDYFKAAVPGLSSSLPPVRNVLGEPINRPANTVAEGVFPVTIAPAVTFKQDPTIDELDRLYQATGYGAGADPKALGYGTFNPKDVVLENGQSIFDAFMQARQTMTVNGLTLRQSLGKLFDSPEYNQAVDADPGQKQTSRGDASRGWMVEQVFNTYNKAIKAELAEASPTANNYLTAASAKQRDDAYLRDVSVQDLVDNPGYYQSHGIDAAVYSAKVRQGATGALLNSLRRH